MRACLVHHADAVMPNVDPQRPLSELGRRQAAWIASSIRSSGWQPAAIWHSGKLRSRQTAEAILRACNPMAPFRMVRGLQPDDPPEWMRDELAAEDRDILLVGHMPHIAKLARLLGAGTAEMPLHGFLLVERRNAGEWVEILRAQPEDR
jgi:phosphohistidine phosphatase